MYIEISGNLKDLEKNLRNLGSVVKADMSKIIRKVLFDLWDLVTEGGSGCDGTPVLTGRARASWMLDTDYSEWVLPPGDYTASIKENIHSVVSALPESERYILFNNLEYIVPLEDGHSKQAPNGFVAQAVAAISEIVAEAAKAAGYEATA